MQKQGVVLCWCGRPTADHIHVGVEVIEIREPLEEEEIFRGELMYEFPPE